MPEPTAADCMAALDRVALKLDQALALLDALPPVDPEALDQLQAAAEAALSTWRPPVGWWW
jgi:MoxR-like ATPase